MALACRVTEDGLWQWILFLFSNIILMEVACLPFSFRLLSFLGVKDGLFVSVQNKVQIGCWVGFGFGMIFADCSVWYSLSY